MDEKEIVKSFLIFISKWRESKKVIVPNIFDMIFIPVIIFLNLLDKRRRLIWGFSLLKFVQHNWKWTRRYCSVIQNSCKNFSTLKLNSKPFNSYLLALFLISLTFTDCETSRTWRWIMEWRFTGTVHRFSFMSVCKTGCTPSRKNL